MGEGMLQEGLDTKERRHVLALCEGSPVSTWPSLAQSSLQRTTAPTAESLGVAGFVADGGTERAV